MLETSLDTRQVMALVLCTLGLVLLWTAIWQRRKARTSFSRLLMSLALFSLTSSLYVAETHVHTWLGISARDEFSRYFIAAMWWISLGYVITRLLDTLLWRGILTLNGELLIPKILVHMTTVFIYLLIAIMFLYFVAGRDVTALVTTSGVFVVAIGYLAKTPFESAFAGLALNLSPMFRKGDLVEIGQWMGTVQDIGWQHVTLKTRGGSLLHIRNLLVDKEIVINYSQPTKKLAYSLEVTLEYEFPVQKAYEIIDEALSELSGVVEEYGISADHFSEFGITYVISFRISDKFSYSSVVHSINSSVYYKVQKVPHGDFGYHRVSSPYATGVSEPMGSIHQASARALNLTPEKRLEALKSVEIFEALKGPDLEELAKWSIPRVFGPPERIIRQGEPGDSMFVVMEGKVQVYLEREGGHQIQVATDGPGQYFGEMALLTGKARGATVRAVNDVVLLEIPKNALEGILQRTPSLAGKIASAVAIRRAQNAALVSAADSKLQEVPHSKTLADTIRIAVLHFFKLDPDTKE